LSSETKSVVSSTLMLFEKIVRNDASLKEEVCISICQAFIHNDENIQNKASRLLLRYNDESLRSVTEEIIKYADSMLMTSKKLLSDFLTVTPKQPDDILPDTSETDEVIGPIQEITTLDELIFLSSQA